MATFGTLGDIEFTLGSNSPRTYRDTSGEQYAEHSRLSGAPSLQHIGPKLSKRTIDINIHEDRTDPSAARQTLFDAMREGLPLTLVLGDTYEGKWVIESLDTEYEAFTLGGDASETTTPRAIALKLTIKEFTGIEPPEEDEQEQEFSGYPYSTGVA